MLLCHTSSIHSDDPIDLFTNFKYVRPPGTGMSLESFIQNRLVPGGSLYNIQTTSFDNNPPGVQYNYSNTGYALLGYLVEKISGMPFDEYCKQKIFQLLCMNQTAWFYSGIDTNIIAWPYGADSGDPLALYEKLDYPCCQLKTTVIDFSKYMLMHMNFGILNGVRVIDSTTEVMMRTPQVNLITGGVVKHDGVPITFNLDECLGFNKITHTSEGNKVFIGHDGTDIGVSTNFLINTSNNTGEFIFADVLTYDPKGISAVRDIHLFLEQSVADTISTTGLPDLNCSYLFNPCEQNLDYWKNNQTKWPLNSVPMRLGTKHYYSKNQILALLNTTTNNDASLVLSKALISAKFNIAQGSELSTIILTINAAMNLIGDHRLPYDNPVPFSSPTGIQMLNLAATLDSYNSGSLNTTACSGFPTSITKSNPVNEIDKTALSYSLSVYPNPSHGSATVSFSLPTPGKVSLTIYDITGRLVKTIANAVLSEGEHTLNLDVNNFRAGIYLLRMQSGQISQTRKFIVQH